MATPHLCGTDPLSNESLLECVSRCHCLPSPHCQPQPAEASSSEPPVPPTGPPALPVHSRPRKPTASVDSYECAEVHINVSQVVQSSSFTHVDNPQHKFNTSALLRTL